MLTWYGSDLCILNTQLMLTAVVRHLSCVLLSAPSQFSELDTVLPFYMEFGDTKSQHQDAQISTQSCFLQSPDTLITIFDTWNR